MKAIALFLMLSIGSFAQAKVVNIPLSINTDGIFTAGTNTYLSMIASPEVDDQIKKACGTDAVLLNLDLHYTVQQGKTGGDVSSITLSGTATCQTSN
jgi:hypothetical protein